MANSKHSLNEETPLQNRDDPDNNVSSESFEMKPEAGQENKSKKAKFNSRYFQESWKVKFPWVERDPKGSHLVFCPYCIKNLKPKTTNIQDHAKSKRHISETSAIKEIPRKILKRPVLKYPKKNQDFENGNLLHNEMIASRVEGDGVSNNEINLVNQSVSVTITENDGIMEAHIEDYKSLHEHQQVESVQAASSKMSSTEVSDWEIKQQSSYFITEIEQFHEEDDTEKIPMTQCNTCLAQFKTQKELFFHLKLHYEDQNEEIGALELPITSEKDVPNIADSPNEMEMDTFEEDEFANFSLTFKWLSKNSMFPKSGNCKTCDVAIRLTKYYLKKHDLSYEHMRQTYPGLTLEEHKEMVSKKSERAQRNAGRFKIVIDDKGRRRVECPECLKLFKRNSIWMHLRIHKDLRPHKCHLCPWAFRQSNDLKCHINAVHQRLSDYQCEICGSSFSRLSSLKLHIKTHSDLRDVLCDVCNKGFRSVSKMKEHRKIHTGEKPFTCDVCGASFRVKSDLTRHRTNVHERSLKRAKKAKKRRPRKTDLTHNHHLQHHQYYTLSEPPQQLEFIEHVLEIEDLSTAQIDPYNPEQIIIYTPSS